MTVERHAVRPWYSRWAVVDDTYLRPEPLAYFDTRDAAQAHADQLNTPRPTPQRTHQDALFETKEA